MQPETKEESEMLAAQQRQEFNGLDVNKLEAPKLTAFERDVQRLAQEAGEKIFSLSYYPWREQDRCRCVLIRHRNPGEPDDFTCHDAETGRNLGWGETKQDAESEAQLKLSKMRERDL